MACWKLAKRTATVWVAAVVLITGCSEEVNLDNAGYACLSPDGEVPPDFAALTFVPDTVLYATVTLAECLSNSCDTNREAACEITVSGDQVFITSEGGYTDESGAGSSCTTDCQRLEATCQTAETLTDQTYTVHYADESIEFSFRPTAAYCIPPQR